MRKTGLQMAVQQSTGREIEELLRELYVAKRHSDQEIADAFSKLVGTDISLSAIRVWRERFGISREDRPALELTA
jgi:hypothetical protein